ncbi:uncharacterized protein LOC135619497 [Musa acuminata AAA Group]|uniref:uncharacterized protein LOC135619497 n=1 Tax=Musa acuminata AAA Group TaxID=214697 RepID=UPI0031E07C27
MNRTGTGPPTGGRNVQQFCGGGTKEGDESLDLFWRIHQNRASSHHGSDHQKVSITKERTGKGSLMKSRMDDLLSADVGKHDYDWLLTPPGTPLFTFSKATDDQRSRANPGCRSNPRSASTDKASRLSVSRSENANSAKPARSSSTTRSSMSNAYSSSTYLSNNSRTAVLDTSTASVTSKPTTPATRSTQSAPSRSPTPVKARPSLPSSMDKPRPSQSFRPAAPTVRPQAPSNTSNSSSSAAATRPSTPIRRAATTPAAAPAITRSASVGRVPATNNRKSSPVMRPSSPAPRARTIPDIPSEAPPNLRTKVPERAVSAGRQRPGTALAVRATSNSEAAAAVSAVRRQSSSPVIARGRLQENSSGNRMGNRVNEVKAADNKKSLASEPAARRPTKPASPTENTAGFGRSISKKSMDMALKHMDIRQSMGGLRGAALFPQSIRSAAQKLRPGRSVAADCNGAAMNNGDIAVRPPNEPLMERECKLDLYESSRCDAILLKEDSKNMNWLHSTEDKSDQRPLFDYRFGQLPEPFGPL